MHVIVFPRRGSISLKPEGQMLFCLGECNLFVGCYLPLAVTPSNPLPHPLAINAIRFMFSIHQLLHVCKHGSEFHAEIATCEIFQRWLISATGSVATEQPHPMIASFTGVDCKTSLKKAFRELLRWHWEHAVNISLFITT